MTFSTFLNQAWADHAKDAAGVAARLDEAKSLISSDDDLTQFAGLASHVFGEHLGNWDQGLQLLTSLKTLAPYSPATDGGKAVQRAIHAMELSAGTNVDLNSLSVSDRIRVLAVAASALSNKDTGRALDLLRSAVDIAETGVTADDPANRSLAVTGNNLACALEEKKERSHEETSLMILAAQTGRLYWERAGTWVHVMRAEYRLAMSFLAMNDFPRARSHAEISKAMSLENNADALDKFFAWEAAAQIEKQAGRNEELKNALTAARPYFEQLNADDKAWCKPILDKLMGAE